MKLFSLRLTTLKSKLYAIVFASFVVRVVAFFLLPSSGSSLAPDEGAYAETSRRLAAGEINNTLFSDNLLVQSRSFLYPSALIIKLGADPLAAVRAVSTIYSLLALFYLIKILLTYVEKYHLNASHTTYTDKYLITVFLIYAFLPSHFFWSIVGLRESTVEFWIIFISFQFQKILFEKKTSRRFPLLLLCLSSILLFSSRPQIGWVLSISLLSYCFVNSFHKSNYRIVIPILLFGVIAGYTFSSPITLEKKVSFSLVNVDSNEVLSGSRVDSSECKEDGEIVILSGIKYSCSGATEVNYGIKIKNSQSPLLIHSGAIEQHHKWNQEGAASVIRTISCPFDPSLNFGSYGCLIWRAPYTTFTFLFRPLLGADVTSKSSHFAAVENIFWLTALLFIVIMFIRNRRLAFFEALAPSLLFFSIYSVAAGAYEGNMGTAFRHKSLTLWVVILLLASTILATQQRKAEGQGISGSSQE
jgi:hypothetical protein